MSPGRARALAGHGAVLAVAAALAVLVTWPLARELLGPVRLADQSLDDYVSYWNNWWLYHALFDLHTSPFYSHEIFHPHGVSLALAPLSLPYGVLSLPLQAVLGPLPGSMLAMKLVVLGSFCLAVHGTWLLLRKLGVPALVALLGGCFYAFVPFRILHLARANYLAGCLEPYFAWALWISMERRSWSAALAAGGILAFAGLCDLSVLPESLLLAAALAGVFALRSRGLVAPLAAAARTFVVTGLLLSPMLVPFLRAARSHEGASVAEELQFAGTPRRTQLTLSPDLNNLCFYLAPSLHELAVPADSAWGEGAQALRIYYHSFRPPGRWPAAEGIVAGLVAAAVLGSACLGLRVRALWPFLVLAVLAFVLALGPYRSWAGETIRMPYWFWMQLPGMNAGRYPAANLRIFHLAVAVLAAAGLATRGRGSRILAGSLLALVLGAWLLRPCSVEPLEVEPVHREIAAATEPGAVLELPADLEATLRKMALGQIVHQRPLMSGPLTRVAPEAWKFFREVPVVRRFLRPPAGGIPQAPEEPEENVRILREWGVAFVVVRRTLATINASAYADLAAYLSLHPGLSVAVSPEGHLLARVAPAP